MNQKEQYEKLLNEAAEKHSETTGFAGDDFQSCMRNFKAGAEWALENPPPTPVVQDDGKLEPNRVHYKGDGEHSIYELEAIARQAVENEICYSLLIQELEAARAQQSSVKMFPIQSERGAKAHPTKIPWAIADLAYSVYSAKYGKEQSLERLAQRGGFGPSEMDMFLPNWRELCSQQPDVSELEKQIELERDAYARALQIALEDGVFFNKQTTQNKVMALLAKFRGK